MEDYMINIGFNVLLTWLANLKGAKNRERFKKAFLKLDRAIHSAYALDKDFDLPS